MAWPSTILDKEFINNDITVIEQMHHLFMEGINLKNQLHVYAA